PVAERIIALGSTLVISADKGTSDEPRIKRMAAAGMDVIITDHHAVPVSGPPPSAYAVVNPGRTDSDYDPYICGAAVAFLTMAKVRTGLLEAGYKQSIPSLVGLMDYVAVATVADCVSLRPDKSYANRAFVRKGLALINQGQRPCWRVFNQQRGGRIGTDDIGFQLAPPIAAAGRLDWADAGVKFLLAKDEQEAKIHWQVLQTENTLRKTIERDLRERAFAMASKIDQQSLVLYFDDGHSGVHGITASRLVENFGKPSAIFAPKGAGARKTHIPMKTLNTEENRPLASGSFRGIPGFHVRDALQFVADHYPHLLVAFGGHEGAAGATIAVHNFKAFAAAYEHAVSAQLENRVLHPVIWVDGDMDADLLNFATLDALLDIEPWGRDFPFPVFSSKFTPVSLRPLGDGTHLKLEL
ncbi:MAG TPA: DHH family phosphoesterase, partial [Myxococcales bacterium]|nr:DHH family phosphoesterase [Myxococcales bacterium]